jgi:hypothetical protein
MDLQPPGEVLAELESSHIPPAALPSSSSSIAPCSAAEAIHNLKEALDTLEPVPAAMAVGADHNHTSKSAQMLSHKLGIPAADQQLVAAMHNLR